MYPLMIAGSVGRSRWSGTDRRRPTSWYRAPPDGRSHVLQCLNRCRHGILFSAADGTWSYTHGVSPAYALGRFHRV